MLAPIALDLERAWMLLPDGGPSMQERVPADGLVVAMSAAMAAYADLQRRVAPRVDELLAAGVPDMRPAAMPARFDEALAAAAGEPAELHARVAAMRATYAGWCERLAALPGGASLDHNDLHPGNVLDGGRRFYDWGDSVVAHPFACLLMPLGYVQGQLGRRPRAGAGRVPRRLRGPRPAHGARGDGAAGRAGRQGGAGAHLGAGAAGYGAR